jgi:hypothetical protein
MTRPTVLGGGGGGGGYHRGGAERSTSPILQILTHKTRVRDYFTILPRSTEV